MRRTSGGHLQRPSGLAKVTPCVARSAASGDRWQLLSGAHWSGTPQKGIPDEAERELGAGAAPPTSRSLPSAYAAALTAANSSGPEAAAENRKKPLTQRGREGAGEASYPPRRVAAGEAAQKLKVPGPVVPPLPEPGRLLGGSGPPCWSLRGLHNCSRTRTGRGGGGVRPHSVLLLNPQTGSRTPAGRAQSRGGRLVY